MPDFQIVIKNRYMSTIFRCFEDCRIAWNTFHQVIHVITTTRFQLCKFILQYFGHREKLKSVGREEDLETLNRTALRLARKVADDTDKIMAAGICNTGVWDPDNETTKILARKMFKVIFV